MRMFLDTMQPNFITRVKTLKKNANIWLIFVCPVAYAEGDIRMSPSYALLTCLSIRSH
jgi:hypothetical protein